MNDLAAMARIVKAQARRVEREAHELRQLAARLEAAASDTSEEDTDHERHDAERGAAREAVPA